MEIVNHSARSRQSNAGHSCNPDYPCPACRPPSMLPDDALALDRMMRGNRVGGLQVVSHANWAWKPRQG